MGGRVYIRGKPGRGAHSSAGHRGVHIEEALEIIAGEDSSGKYSLISAGMASAGVGLSDQEWINYWHGAITGFKSPCYTYVIHLDLQDWRPHERALMDIYSKDVSVIIDDIVDTEKEFLLSDVTYEWKASLAMKLQNHHGLGQTLCESADIAVRRPVAALKMLPELEHMIPEKLSYDPSALFGVESS